MGEPSKQKFLPKAQKKLTNPPSVTGGALIRSAKAVAKDMANKGYALPGRAKSAQAVLEMFGKTAAKEDKGLVEGIIVEKGRAAPVIPTGVTGKIPEPPAVKAKEIKVPAPPAGSAAARIIAAIKAAKKPPPAKPPKKVKGKSPSRAKASAKMVKALKSIEPIKARVKTAAYESRQIVRKGEMPQLLKNMLYVGGGAGLGALVGARFPRYWIRKWGRSQIGKGRAKTLMKILPYLGATGGGVAGGIKALVDYRRKREAERRLEEAVMAAVEKRKKTKSAK